MRICIFLVVLSSIITAIALNVPSKHVSYLKINTRDRDRLITFISKNVALTKYSYDAKRIKEIRDLEIYFVQDGSTLPLNEFSLLALYPKVLMIVLDSKHPKKKLLNTIPFTHEVATDFHRPYVYYVTVVYDQFRTIGWEYGNWTGSDVNVFTRQKNSLMKQVDMGGPLVAFESNGKPLNVAIVVSYSKQTSSFSVQQMGNSYKILLQMTSTTAVSNVYLKLATVKKSMVSNPYLGQEGYANVPVAFDETVRGSTFICCRILFSSTRFPRNRRLLDFKLFTIFFNMIEYDAVAVAIEAKDLGLYLTDYTEELLVIVLPKNVQVTDFLKYPKLIEIHPNDIESCHIYHLIVTIDHFEVQRKDFITCEGEYLKIDHYSWRNSKSAGNCNVGYPVLVKKKGDNTAIYIWRIVKAITERNGISASNINKGYDWYESMVKYTNHDKPGTSDNRATAASKFIRGVEEKATRYTFLGNEKNLVLDFFNDIYFRRDRTDLDIATREIIKILNDIPGNIIEEEKLLLLQPLTETVKKFYL